MLSMPPSLILVILKNCKDTIPTPTKSLLHQNILSGITNNDYELNKPHFFHCLFNSFSFNSDAAEILLSSHLDFINFNMYLFTNCFSTSSQHRHYFTCVAASFLRCLWRHRHFNNHHLSSLHHPLSLLRHRPRQ